MRNKICLMMLMFSFVLSNVSAFASETYFSGAGTEANPYLIGSASDLIKLAELTNNKTTAAEYADKCYQLTGDIDMTGISYVPISFASNGAVGAAFAGMLDGNGHIIKNVTFDMTKVNAFNTASGVIGMLKGPGVVKNLGVENMNANGANKTYMSFGGIVGYLAGTGTKVENCYVKGMTVSGTQQPTFVGGIVGRAGGENGTVKNCYATDLSCTLTNTSYTAGIVGGSDKNTNTAENCYTTYSKVQGWAASTGGTMKANNCYASGTIADMSAEILGSAYKSHNTVKNDGLPILVWESTEGYDKIKAEFEGEGTDEEPYIISSAEEFAKLSELTNQAATMADYADKAYKLTGDIDMTGISYVPISFSGSFKGTLDGDGHIIKNVTFNNTKINAFGASAGIVGLLGENGIVKNLGVENITVESAEKNYMNIAGIVGGLTNNSAKIENCYVKGMTVTATSSPTFVGGIVGRVMGNSGIIINCYTKGLSYTLANANNSGGIVGSSDKNTNTAENCYTTHSRVQGNQAAAGGTMPLTNCFGGITTENYPEASTLGNGFENDTEMINDGMPILAWEFNIAHPDTVYYTVKSGNVDILDGVSNVSVKEPIVITFDRVMNTDTYSKIKVLKGDKEVTDAVFEVGSNGLKIKVNFEYNTEYTVFVPKNVLSQKDENGKSAKADEKVIRFRTEPIPKAVTIESVKINGQDEVTNLSVGDEVTVEAVVKNTGNNESQAVALMVMIFGQDKIMKYTALDTCMLKDTNETLKVKFVVPENAGENPRLKVMVWDSITSMNVMK